MALKKKAVSVKRVSKNIISGKNARILPPRESFLDRFSKAASKPATILYKKLPDDMILITRFENFLSLDELFDKYGRVAAKAYSDYPYHMTSSIGAVFITGMAGVSHIAVGQIFSKGEFSKLIGHIKKCGGLLHNLIAEVNKGQVKRIEI